MGPTLVTGGTGFAGSHLIDLLGEQHTPVVAWCRPGGTPPRPIAHVRWTPVDLLDREAVRGAVRELRPSRVYHCAGAAHVGQSWDTTAATLAGNVLATHHLVEALRRDVPDARIMITSSALVYTPSSEPIAEDHVRVPASPYGLSKLAVELIGEDPDCRPTVCIARPFNHFGPRQNSAFVASGFARRIAEIEAGRCPPEIPVGNLEPRRDLCDVRDTVRAYKLIMERGAPGRAYNVCSGKALAVSALLDTLVARARVGIRVVTDPTRYRPNDLPIVVGDFTRIRDELGWSPAIPFERTVDDLLEYWRDRVRAV